MYGWGRDHDEGLISGREAPTTMASQQGQGQGQWGPEETRELIRIRADMERDSSSSSTKRSKALWEAVSSAMLATGFSRTPDQCKCKWKNLLNRYKGKETSDPGNGRQCPYFEELHALFTQRAKDMQRLLLESEVGSPQSRKKTKRSSLVQSSEEFSEDEEEGNDEDSAPARTKRGKRKNVAEKSSKASSMGTEIREILGDFFEQQMRMEKQWMEMIERRSREKMLFEQEWRESMEKLERERLLAERAWIEREEQRRVREESRAERRDTLLTTLLNSLIDDNNL